MDKNVKVKVALEHEFDVAKFLRENKGKGAYSGNLIVECCELYDKKELRMIIHRLREQGLQICSNNQGYWLAENDEEVLETVRMLKGRAYSILHVAYRMQSNLLDQEELDGVWWE